MPNRDFVKTEYTPEEQKINREQEMKDAFMEESGLEGASVEYLRKQMLSSEEAVAAKKEQVDDVRARKSRKPDWDEYVDARRRWGRALHHSDLIKHLRNLIPGLYVIDGTIRNTISLYIWDHTAEFEAKTGGTVYLGWCHFGWNPEYEIDLVNDVGVAVSQLRGWRTSLVRMICRRDARTFLPKSLFSEDAALAEFGSPTNGLTASKYREHMWKWRNTSPDQARSEHATMEAMQRHRYA
jgi:hypothetical protein